MKTVTAREEEILQRIRENPLIPQEELALKVGITRSSISVHISNLIKKGLILGKGYIIGRQQPVCVIGGVNMDISALPSTPLRTGDSNPGKISMSAGGVGFNIACNLACLGVPVYFIGAFGTDANAAFLKQKCFERAVDISLALTVDGRHSSSYMCVNDENGDMVAAVNDMEIYEYLTSAYIEQKLPLINKSSLCIVDTNIPAETIKLLAKCCTVPIIAEPVSAHKAVKLLPILDKLYALTPNKVEARAICEAASVSVKPLKRFSKTELKSAAGFFIERGVQRVYISLGADGLFCADKNEQYALKPFLADKGLAGIKNTSGAGDCQAAAVAWSILKNMSLKESVKAGIAASSFCLETEEAVNDTISEGMLYERMRKIS